jgi:hypothetical protein
MGGHGFPPVECLVFMTKKLHYDLLPPAGEKFWIFAGLDAVRLIKQGDTGCMTIKLMNVLQNRFSESEILIGDERLGTIYFALA